ncbi:uncharacterized protein KY384_002624 [Bacidia gigantensis]|uniref:uncharacterized protein n=1 Tax=Bacidia gigantensis TaxID=2732470 RepID=UPI001D05B3D9|nr:uncharacterized protein KY384_002624 [Bacidia gigantensis]KAG8532746.1 hypothetical protein KY384_002624 [Bacidia gigantensis]
MGTHISRVKSVDLDAWTDEQLQSVLKWGNARANKYWEAKLATGHVPSEAKIENFIRTKYESKRWVMDGPMPDPASLDVDGDDDVPLNVVQEKAKLDRASSQRAASTSSQPVQPPAKPTPQIDLFGDVPAPPARPSTTDTPSVRPPPPKQSAPPKPTKASDSLLGLDFYGGPTTTSPGRPSSSTAIPTSSNVPSRPDLKQSILSLYSSAPKPQPAAQHSKQGSFGGMNSPPGQPKSSLSDLDDAFAGLGVSSATSQPSKPVQPAKSDPFAAFANPTNQRSSFTAPQVTSPLSGGGFFDAGPKPAPKPAASSKPTPKPQASLTPMESNDFGDFSFASSPPAAPSKPPPPSASVDLFDMSDPITPAAPPKASQPARPVENSPFNLSASATTLKPAAKAAPAPTTQSSSSANFGALSDADAWGANDAWATPSGPSVESSKPKPTHAPIPAPKAPAIAMTNNFSAWGGTEPITNQSSQGPGFGASSQAPSKVTPDEDFGGWSTSAPVRPAPSNPPTQSKPAGGFGGDDLYSNVWG